MKDLTARVEGIHNEFAKRPPLFTMIVAELNPVDDDQLAILIEADAKALIARGIEPVLRRYHPFVYDHEPNRESRAQAVMAHAQGLLEFNEIDIARGEKKAFKELHRLDRSDLARFARMATKKKATKTSDHQETAGSRYFEGVIRNFGDSKKSLASLRAANESRITIRLSWLVFLIFGILLGLGTTYLSQEKTNEAKKFVSDFKDAGFMHRAALDDDWSGRPWRDRPWESKIEFEYRSHKKLFDCDHTLDDFKKLFPVGSERDDDVDAVPGVSGVQEGDLSSLRTNQP